MAAAVHVDEPMSRPTKPTSSSTRRAATSGATAGPARARRNLPWVEREREILDAAMELFAEHGFGASLQQLADRVGVTQPLLHRYFPHKSDLVDRCKQELMRGHWKESWRDILADRNRPLRERMLAWYADYLPRIYRRVWYRNFLFAAIDDPKFARDYLNQVTDQLLVVVMEEVRRECGCPPSSEAPFDPREYELVWGMHSTFAFLGIRVLIYRFPMPDPLETLVCDQIDAYLLAAGSLLRELMASRTAGRAAGRRPKLVARR